MAVVSLLALALTSAVAPQCFPDSTLSEAVVTGTRTPKLWADTPVPTYVIGRNDIRRSDATNLRELLTPRTAECGIFHTTPRDISTSTLGDLVVKAFSFW